MASQRRYSGCARLPANPVSFGREPGTHGDSKWPESLSARRKGLATPVVECVPNFSEGRDRGVVERIAQAIQSAIGAHLLAYESDSDHHRSVFTIAGSPESVV